MLSFSTVTTTDGLARLAADWEALDDGSGPGVVFRSFAWQGTWWRLLGRERGRGRALHVVVGRDAAGRVRGILPLYTEEAPVAGVVPRRRVALLADGVVGSDYLGLIARRDDEARLAPAFAAHLARDPGLAGVDLVELTDLGVGDPLGAALAPALDGALFDDVRVEPRYHCPYARLDGEDLESYLGARPAGFGAQLAARRRELEAQRGFRLEIRSEPEAIVRGLGPLFALHRARWAEEGGSDAIPDGAVEKFHVEAAERLAARGWARLALLSVDGRTVAAGYGFARAGRFAYYQAGLDPDWRRRSVGTVVLGALIGRSFEEGLREFDFLRGEEAYKAIWATDVRATCAVRAWARHRRARVAAAAARTVAAARAAAHRLLPERGVGVVRALRRRFT